MKDLSGLKFGKLTVLKYWGCDKYRHSKWLCLCECGNQKIAKEDTLVRGVTYSCGCVTKRGKCNIKDISGKKFGKLTALHRAYDDAHQVKWVCKCDCGNLISVNISQLTSGHTKSCGCIEHPNLIGKRFGKLIVVSAVGYKWSCKCDCGNTIITTTYRLTHERDKSCGCIKYRRLNKYDLSGEYGIGYTKKQEEFYFDLEDYDRIKDYTWNIDTHYGYVVSDSIGKRVMMHRLVMNCCEKSKIVDHIYHNKRDNRKSQLRVGTMQQNAMNHKINIKNSTGHSGVSFDKKRNKYYARIRKNYKNKFLGYYDNIEDAITAREKAEIELFGEYRCKEQ